MYINQHNVWQAANFKIVSMCEHPRPGIITLFVLTFIIQRITVEVYLKPQKDSISPGWTGSLCHCVWCGKTHPQKGQIDSSVTVPLSPPSFINESRQISGAT